MNYKSGLLNVINLLQCYNFLLLNDRNSSFCTGDSEGKWSWQLTPIQILLLCSDMMFPSFWLSSGCICSCCASFPYPAVARLLWHTHTHTYTNHEDERRRVAPLPALQQVAQTNWQQQNAPEKAFFLPEIWVLYLHLTSFL